MPRRPTSDLSFLQDEPVRPSLWQRLRDWYLSGGTSATRLARDDYEQVVGVLRQMAPHLRDADPTVGVCCIFGDGEASIRIDSLVFLEAFAELAHQRRDLLLEVMREQGDRNAW